MRARPGERPRIPFQSVAFEPSRWTDGDGGGNAGSDFDDEGEKKKKKSSGVFASFPRETKVSPYFPLPPLQSRGTEEEATTSCNSKG